MRSLQRAFLVEGMHKVYVEIPLIADLRRLQVSQRSSNSYSSHLASAGLSHAIRPRVTAAMPV
ncbi:MAG: hypothetical protein WA869_19865, partial [Alloacidobacterium sp.]